MEDVRRQLIEVFRLSLDPSTDSSTRQQAYQVICKLVTVPSCGRASKADWLLPGVQYCESFKASSPDCPVVGLDLALLQDGVVEGSTAELRYFGLQVWQ